MRKDLLNTIYIMTAVLWDGMLCSLANINHLPDYTASYPRIMQSAQQDFIHFDKYYTHNASQKMLWKYKN